MINDKQKERIKKLADLKPDKNKDFNEGWKNACYAVLIHLTQE